MHEFKMKKGQRNAIAPALGAAGTSTPTYTA